MQKPTGPHYTRENCHGWQVEVTLDGRTVDSVIEADTAQGWLKRWNRAGRRAGSPDMPVETLYGKVTVVIGEPWGDAS